MPKVQLDFDKRLTKEVNNGLSINGNFDSNKNQCEKLTNLQVYCTSIYALNHIDNESKLSIIYIDLMQQAKGVNSPTWHALIMIALNHR